MVFAIPQESEEQLWARREANVEKSRARWARQDALRATRNVEVISLPNKTPQEINAERWDTCKCITLIALPIIFTLSISLVCLLMYTGIIKVF